MPVPDACVLTVGTLHPPLLVALSERFRVLAAPEEGASVRAIVGDGKAQIDATLLDRVPDARLIALFSVGYDCVDMAAARARGVTVVNTPGVLDGDVADLAVGLLLAAVRRIPQADGFLRVGGWRAGRFPLTGSLCGARVGILGLGRVGAAVAKRLSGFEVEILYHGRRRQPEMPFRYCPTPRDLAAASDALVVAVPGGAGTERMVDAEVLRALGPGGILVNVGRGSVVDEAALVEALRTGVIATAGLDVFAAEPEVPAGLTALERVVLSPHMGAGTERTFGRMTGLVVGNLEAWFADGRALTPV